MSETLLIELVKSGILVGSTAVILKLADTRPGRRLHAWMRMHWQREFVELIPLAQDEA